MTYRCLAALLLFCVVLTGLPLTAVAQTERDEIEVLRAQVNTDRPGGLAPKYKELVYAASASVLGEGTVAKNHMHKALDAGATRAGFAWPSLFVYREPITGVARPGSNRLVSLASSSSVSSRCVFAVSSHAW